MLIGIILIRVWKKKSSGRPRSRSSDPRPRSPPPSPPHQAVLASIIFVALKNMMNFTRCRELYHLSKSEWFQWMVAAVVTTFGGVTYGILFSIVLSILLLLKTASSPTTAVLGRLPGGVWVPVKEYEEAEEVDGVKVFRFDGPLTFANKDHLEQKLSKMDLQDANQPDEGAPLPKVQTTAVVVDCGSVSAVDTSAAKMLSRVAAAYAARGVTLFLSNWHGVDRTSAAVLEDLRVYDAIPLDRIYFSLEDAVQAAVRDAAEDGFVAESDVAVAVVLGGAEATGGGGTAA